jgi:hypothetical protein
MFTRVLELDSSKRGGGYNPQSRAKNGQAAHIRIILSRLGVTREPVDQDNTLCRRSSHTIHGERVAAI